MSAFYDQASLVVVPSGYKAGKVYAQKPLTTDGQLSFTRSTGATRVNSAGLIETVSSNVPRLDYTDSTCPKLLLEPQRTQILHRSTPGNFTTTATANRWIEGGGTPAVENQAVGIFGTNTATRYTKTAGQTTTDFLYYTRASVVSGSTYTVSGYIKLGTATNAVIVINNTTAWNTVPGANFVATAANGYSDWKRFSITFTAPVSNQVNVHIGYHDETGVAQQNTGTFFVEGFQLELGNYATSLIPSSGAAVTRGAESTTLATIPSSTATSFTLFVDFANLTASNAAYVIRNAANSISYAFYYYAGRWDVFNGSTFITNFSITSVSAKIAIVSTPSTVKVFINGVDNTKAGASPSANLSQKIDLASVSASTAALNTFLYLPSALSDADAIALTA